MYIFTGRTNHNFIHTYGTGNFQLSCRLQVFLFMFILFFSVPLTSYSGAVVPRTGQISDTDLTIEIERELARDEAVSSHLIDVKTENGVVELSGTVNNILAKERAFDIAETIKGVRSIINLINVKPVPRTDAELRKDVNAALKRDSATDAYEIKTEVRDGVVTLTGTVDSWAEKRLSSDVVMGVKGIQDLVNKIRVAYDEERPDHEIKADVIRRLRSDLYVDDKLINVEVENGEVTLEGSVGSLAEKNRAVADSWVTGTESVNDGLEVEWKRRNEMKRREKFILKSDEQLEKDVQASFYYDPRLYKFDIDVSVENGIATLSGVVDNLKARKAAGEDAENTIGIWMVKNHLKVRPTVLPEDAQLAHTIEETLENDPYLDRHDITYAIRNYKVYLYGTVDTYFEKLRAEDILSSIPGVVVIANKLKLNGDKRERKDDREIREGIESEFFWNFFIDSDRISVKVENGVATLEGEVDTWQESKEATELAIEAGAKSVINHLGIRGMPDLS